MLSLLDWVFAIKRRALGNKLRRIIAADRAYKPRGKAAPVNERIGTTWKYLYAARMKAVRHDEQGKSVAAA